MDRAPGPDFTDAQAISWNFPLCSASGWAQHCVVDGDTIRIGARRIRLTGYDAPEMDGECSHERTMAIRATQELSSWLNIGSFELTGGPAPPRDRYGRELRAAGRNGELLAEHMVSQGLAHSAQRQWNGGWGDWC